MNPSQNMLKISSTRETAIPLTDGHNDNRMVQISYSTSSHCLVLQDCSQIHTALHTQ